MKLKDYLILVALIALIVIGIFLLLKEDSSNKPISFKEHSKYQIYALDLPSEISFAGERCPLERQDIAERFDRELHVNTYWRSNTLLLMKRINRWFPMIERVFKNEGIPDDFKYLAIAETMLQNLESPAGAAGFWQLLPGTAKDLGLEVNEEVDERYDQLKATYAAAAYLKRAKKRFGSWTNVAASYNRGMNGYQRALTKQKVNNFYDLKLNRETSRYIFRILAFKEIIEHPEKYGFNIKRQQYYPSVKTSKLKIDSTISNIVNFAHSQGITYKTLRVHNPWINGYSITNRHHKTYIFLIPDEKDNFGDKAEKKDSTTKVDTVISTDTITVLDSLVN